ncbi:hypothetical protein PoB_006706800 [Plakobranchus ocellatus]|uniref:Uncharacterized protein n=1 Tax=Plakobranchus ocellatus TaxID=259542 RepID=A0AAV4D8R4_9GAST|nr:hypothetical protein PoB_006706800 [Plakobranchus ocellatus]
MKYVAVFFVAFYVAAIADTIQVKPFYTSLSQTGCYLEGDRLRSGGAVDCSSYYNAETDVNTGLTYCCKDEDRSPTFTSTCFCNKD